MEINKVHKPKPKKFLEKGNFSNSGKGTIAGLIILGIASVNLCLFFALEGEDEAEYVSKISNTIINIFGIFALLIGISEFRHLKSKEEINDDIFDLDIFLLKFTSFFRQVQGAYEKFLMDET